MYCSLAPVVVTVLVLQTVLQMERERALLRDLELRPAPATDGAIDVPAEPPPRRAASAVARLPGTATGDRADAFVDLALGLP